MQPGERRPAAVKRRHTWSGPDSREGNLIGATPVTGKGLLDALVAGDVPERVPYIPLIGRIACTLGQVSEDAFTGNPHTQATVLAETATALRADAVTVGLRTDPALGTSVVERIRPLLAGRGVVACLGEPDVAGARAYGESAVDMIFLVEPDLSEPSKLRAFTNVCNFFRIPVILVDPHLVDAAHVAEQLRLHGAIIPTPTGADPGLVGGGLSTTAFVGETPEPPRRDRFFWSFSAEVDGDTSPEELARLGTALAH